MATLTLTTGTTEVETLEASAGNVRLVQFDASATHYEITAPLVATTVLEQNAAGSVALADAAANGGAEGFVVYPGTPVRYPVPNARSTDSAKRRIWLWSGTNSSTVSILAREMPAGR